MIVVWLDDSAETTIASWMRMTSHSPTLSASGVKMSSALPPATPSSL